MTHHARQFGQSKYGLERIFKVILDLMVVSFLSRFFAKPMYVFGGFGLISLVVSMLCFIWMLVLKLGWGVSFILTPLPVVISMTFLVGIMGLLMGLLAEVLVRTYFESQDRKSYVISRITPPRD